MKSIFQKVTSILFFALMFTLVGFVLPVEPTFAMVSGGVVGYAVSFVKLPAGILASSYGNLTASAPTTINFTGFVPEFIVVGTVDADLVVDSISVTIDADNVQNISDQQVIQAMSKLLMAGLLGADVKVGSIIKIADGQINLSPGQQCRVVLGNAGATTPGVYALSVSPGSRPIRSSQSSINANSNTIVSGCDALLFEDSNYSKCTVTFANGHVESDLTLVELAALNVANPLSRATDADGKLAGVNVIDFRGLRVASVQLFAGAGGALSYYTLKY